MPVNFGILQSPQMQASPVMGSAPSTNSSSVAASDPLNDLSEGFLSSYSKGQQIANNAEVIKQNQMQTKQMEQKVSDEQQRRDAAKQGWDQYLDVLGKQDPVAKVDAETKMADLQKNNALARTADAQSYNALLTAQAQVWGRTSQGRTPEEKQAIYEMSIKDLPTSVKKTMPEAYSDSAMMAGMTIINYDLADYKAKHPESNQSSSGLGKIQDDITKVKDVINKRKSVGLDTTDQEAQLKQLELNAKNTSEGTNSSQQANQMRDEVNNLTKSFRDVNDAYGRIQASAEKPTAAGDISLIFNYMKMLDPSSVVREGEFATAQNAAGIPNRIVAQYNKLLNGERLADETRADFVDTAGKLYKSQEKSYEAVASDYTDRAKRAGLNPADVVVDPRVKGRDRSGAKMITIKNNKTGETKQVTEEEAKKLGAM